MKKVIFSGSLSSGTGDPRAGDVAGEDSRSRTRMLALRILFIFCLLAAIIVEGYYIVTLRDRISTQTEELKRISFQLQTMKNERDTLHEELSTVKGSPGEEQNGDTAQR